MPVREPSEYEFVTSKTLDRSESFTQAKDTNRKAVEMGFQTSDLTCLRSQLWSERAKWEKGGWKMRGSSIM